ncbi:MAG: hypothetical protein ACI88H_003817 [Cocleimonas sp.]|jgi:hypothetical protein|uniref:restriction endonuclease n=1 Tax=Shewanella sp. ALD9 TaxID=2058330 RepID=UPI0018D4E372|nr:restriction endonuclease [Shewanella sp. ALD9]
MLKLLSEITLETPLVIEAGLTDYKLPTSVKQQLELILGGLGYGFDTYTSYAITDKAREDKAANYAIIPNQYFVFASKMFDFATELYKYFVLYERLRPHASKLVGDESYIIKQINADPDIVKLFDDNNDIALFAKFLDKDNSKYRLGSKRLINDNGVPRGSRDCFGSVILKEINLPDASSSILGRLVFDLCANPSIYDVLVQLYSNAKIDKDVEENKVLELSSSTIRTFISDVFTYLFSNKIEDVLFDILENVITSNGKVYKELVIGDIKIYHLLLESEVPLTEQDLTSGQNIRYFTQPFEREGKFFYLTNQWEDNSYVAKNSRNITSFAIIFNQIYTNLKIIKENDVYKLINTAFVNNCFDSLSKPFLLLAGISGTGKTRFVREQAKGTGSLTETYCLTSVRPDWHEPSDLLGYISRLSGQAEYVTTDVLQFMAKSWRAIVDAGLIVSAKSVDEQGDVLTVSGDKAQLDRVLPYWLCLDEMNLAPVEQYFADYLSVVETREWRWHAESFTYQSDPLLKKNVIMQFDANGAPDLIYNAKLRSELGFVGAAYDDVWALFGQYGLGVPFNLIVAGTVNMDETTHGFSRKVIDRALSFDFGEFFPNDFDSFFVPTITHKTLSYPIYSHAQLDDLPVIDRDGNKTIGFLNEINSVLDNTPFKLAFRALNELLLAVITTQPTDELQLKAVWDDFLMCKVLPRIEGDSDKLASKSADRSLLEQLAILLQQEFSVFWDEDKNSVKARPDLYRENAKGSDKVIRVACRSKAKIEWMETRLARSGFTSFWP